MANTYLNKTFSGSGSLTTWTFSAWIKKCDSAATGTIFAAYTDGSNHDRIIINSNGTLSWYAYTSGSYVGNKNTNRVFRDTNAWYHIVCQWNTTSGTASQRMRIYINGVEETSFATDTNPSSSASSNFNNHNRQHVIGSAVGSLSGTAEYFNGVMSHVHFTDGYAYAASTFGSTDSTTGEWKINTSPSVSYGTNGFFILKDGNSVTDQSGQSNNWSVGGGTLTKTEDNPSNVFATGNPLIGIHSNGSVLVPHTYSNGNLTSTSSGQQWRIHQSTLGASSGKYYAEFKLISNSGTWYSYVGIYDLDGYAQKVSGYPYLSDMANTYGLKDSNGQIHTGGSGTSYGVSYGTGNIIGVAMDLDNNKLYFSKDGTWMNSANPSNGTGGYSITADKTYAFGIQQYAQNSIVWSANYGNGYIGTTEITTNTGTGYQDADGNGRFYYAVPTGFRCLSTKGLNQ